MNAARRGDTIRAGAEVTRIVAGMEQVRLSGVEGERALWCAVLHEALKDLNGRTVDGTRDARLHRDGVVSWIGSRDFHVVCNLAGLDGHVVAEALRRRIAEAERYPTHRRRAPRNPPTLRQASSRGLPGAGVHFPDGGDAVRELSCASEGGGHGR